MITAGTGKHYIDTHEYDVHTGSFFIIPPGQIHRWDLSSDTDGYVLFFTKKYFLLDFNIKKFKSFPFFKSTFEQPHVLLNYEELDDIVSNLKKIHTEYFNRNLDFHEMIRLYMGQMFVKLARIYSNHSSIKSVSNYELVQLSIYENLIEKHYIEHKPVPFYAEKMNLTTKQLNYLCRNVIDKKPSELILDRLILEAKRLIIHTEYSITHISNLLNFNESSYFNRTFKRMCHKTPEQYRNSFSNFIFNDK